MLNIKYSIPPHLWYNTKFLCHNVTHQFVWHLICTNNIHISPECTNKTNITYWHNAFKCWQLTVSLSASLFKFTFSCHLNLWQIVETHVNNIYFETQLCNNSFILGNPRLSSTGTVSVLLQDENDNPPVFSQSTYTFSLRENNEPDVLVATLSATDMDTGRNGFIRLQIYKHFFAYHIEPKKNCFSLKSHLENNSYFCVLKNLVKREH